MTPEGIKKNGAKAFAEARAQIEHVKQNRRNYAGCEFDALFDILSNLADYLEAVAVTLDDQGLRVSRQQYAGDH